MVNINASGHPDQASKLPVSVPTATTAITTYPNLLAQYSSYTYNIALQVTTRSNYNLMLDSQKYDGTRWTTIIHSGGVGADRAHRPATPPSSFGIAANTTPTTYSTLPIGTKQYFSTDLYIDDLNLTSIVGQSSASKSSNSTDITFKIVEPYGMSFLDNLYDFVHDAEGLNEDNYTQLPFLLVINFYGYTEEGIPTRLNNATKYLPIALVNIVIKLNTGGATYDVTAMPYNENGVTESYGRLNSDIELTDSTLTGMFNKLAGTLNNDQYAMVRNGDIQFPDLYSIKVIPQNSTYFGNINIGTSNLTKPSDNTPRNSPMNPPESSSDSAGTVNVDIIAKARNIGQYQSTSAVIASQQKVGSVIQFNNNNVNFPKGSSILEVINAMILSSEYITKPIIDYQQKMAQIAQQIQTAEKSWLAALAQYNSAATKFNKQYAGLEAKDTTKASTSAYYAMQDLFTKQAALRKQAQPQVEQIWKAAGTAVQYPLKWFKISPEVQLGNYDVKRNTYQKLITFYISPYLIFGSYSDNAPKVDPTQHVVKTYDYIFTGNNTEILDFNIEFNNAFVTWKQSNSITKGVATGNKVANAPIIPDTGLTLIPAPSTTNQGQTIVMVPTNPENPTNTGQMTPAKCDAGDLASTIYTPTDLIEANLTIIGDPDYIGQDSIFLRPAASMTPYNNTAGTPQGILFDNGEIFFQLNFKTPQDYNMDTSRADFASSLNTVIQRRNIFQGYYRVISVASKFTGGKFTQELSTAKYTSNQTNAPTAV